MKKKQGDQEQRDPGHIQECCWTGAGEEYAYLVEIAQWLLCQNCFRPAQRKCHQREVDPGLKFDIEQRADPRQHAAAQRVEIALQQISEYHDRG